MLKISKKVTDRFATSLKRFQEIAIAQKERDVSEADTVTLIKDILTDVFGYDKYLELTSEQQIKGTYCDLAVKIEGKVKYLIEAKSAGTNLNENHLKQAVNYGANLGVEWVVLTNALDWKLYRIRFSPHIQTEEIVSFNLTKLTHKNEDDQQKLFLLCREGITVDAMDSFHQQTQVLNRYSLACIILSEPVVSSIRRELRRIFPDVRVAPEQITSLLSSDVLKRDVLDDEKAKEVQSVIKKKIAKLEREANKESSKKQENQEVSIPATPAE